MHHGGARRAIFRDGIFEDDDGGLNRFKRGLDFAGALIALARFFREAMLNDGPESEREAGVERFRSFAENCCAGFESGAAFERETAGGGFVEDDSQRPQIAAVIGGFAAQNFRCHVGERAADAGAILHRGVGARAGFGG